MASRVLLLFTAWIFGACAYDIHKHMTLDEIRSTFHVDSHVSVPEYEVVHISNHNVRRRSIARTGDSSNSIDNAHKKLKNSREWNDKNWSGRIEENSGPPPPPQAATHIRLEAFGRPLNLTLVKNDGLFKKGGLKIWTVEPNATSQHGVEYIEHPESHDDIGEIYQDEENQAAVLLRNDKLLGHLLVEGSIGHDLVIKPLPSRLHHLLDTSTTEATAKTPSKTLPKGPSPADDDEMFLDADGELSAEVAIDTGLPIRRKKDRVNHHIVYKRKDGLEDTDSDYAFMEPDHLAKRYRRSASQRNATGNHFRTKREAPYTIYPEILVIVDYDGYRLHGGDNLQIKRYFVSFWNGVDLRYKLLKGPKIRISIAGIIISRGRDATPYLERNRVGRDAIDSAAALTDMGKYLFRERRLPVYDIAVAITKYDMCRRRKGGRCTKGTAGTKDNENIMPCHVHILQNTNPKRFVETVADALGTNFTVPSVPNGADGALFVLTVIRLDMCRRSYPSDVCNRGTAGFAYVGGACVVNKRLEKVNSVAIIEDTGGFSGIIVAAHEVGHLLGAVHDGSPPPSYLGGPGAEKCEWTDGYIMSDLRHTERGFRWSTCSVASFHHFLNGDTATCLYNSPHEDDSLPRVLPGKLLTLDAQCRRDRGTSACFKDNRVCAQLFCFDAGSGYCVAYRPAAEGSPCGDGQYCLNGRCVAEHENIIPDYSQNTPSYIRRDGQSNQGRPLFYDEEDDANPEIPNTYNYQQYTTKPPHYNTDNPYYSSQNDQSTTKKYTNYPTTQNPYRTFKSFSLSTTKSPYDFRNYHRQYTTKATTYSINNYYTTTTPEPHTYTTKNPYVGNYYILKQKTTRNPYNFADFGKYYQTTSTANYYDTINNNYLKRSYNSASYYSDSSNVRNVSTVGINRGLRQ